MRTTLAIAFLGVAAAAGCLNQADQADDVGQVSAALGQPMGDYPSYDERVVLYGTNRARTDPTAEGWPAYPAQPPLQWNYDLNRSARAHSTDMRDTPCFQHESCDGTDPFVRIKTFYTGPWTAMGENIAGGPTDGLSAVHNWIYEVGATPGETGHRDSIFSAKFTLVGVGYAAGGMPKQVNNFWTQDFVGTPVTRPRMTDGIHFPATVAAGGTITFATTYADSAAPSRIFAVVDGTCTPLALKQGTAAQGAYEGTRALADGCHGYYFLATAGTTDVTYPDSGTLQVGVGAGAAGCALFATGRMTSTCSGGMGGMSGAGGGGGGAAGGAAGGSAGGSGAAGASGTGSGGAGGAIAVTTPPPPRDNSGVSGGCSLTGGNAGPGKWLVCALLALFALALRRRRVVR